MNNNIFEQPPQEPHNVFTHENNTHSFTRRTISWVITIAAIILLVGMATGWGFGMKLINDEPAERQAEVSATAIPGTSLATQPRATAQSQDTATEPRTGWAQSFKNFIKGLIADFRAAVSSGTSSLVGGTQNVSNTSDAVESDNAAGGVAVEGQDNAMNLVASGEPLTEVTQVTENSAGNTTVMNGAEKEALAASQALQQNEVEEIVENPEETLPPEYFEGKIVDYEGKPAGDIKAIIRNSEGERSFYFTLDQSLTPADKSREFQILYDDVEIIEENGSAYVKLSKAQTESIAKSLFEDDKAE